MTVHPPVRLKQFYRDTTAPHLMKKLNLKNIHQVPRLKKIVINIGLGEGVENVKLLDAISLELGIICGQRAAITRSKKSISNFKIRQGDAIGCMVTLRGNHMYEFLDRLRSVALPRVRDFKGLSPRSFDGRGNFTIGLKEQLIFPEIDYDKVQMVHGMDISIVTSAKNDGECRELLEALGIPFQKN